MSDPLQTRPVRRVLSHAAGRTPGRAWLSRGLALAAAAAITAAGPVGAQDPAVTPEVSIDQADIDAGKVPLRQLLESGSHFFSVPFIIEDGFGEGRNGPRAWQRRAFYPHSPFSPYPSNMDMPAAQQDPASPPIPYLQLDGLGAQSCYECHQSIGTYLQEGTQNPAATIRKPGVFGGSGGLANNAFINPEYPNPMTLLVRNPPHIFGTGYTNQIAWEMTHTLRHQREVAQKMARQNPGAEITVSLHAKGVAFGTLGVTYAGDGQGAGLCGMGRVATDFDFDESAVEGIACDITVRPFQWKGIASSVRHFVRDALDFHFSMQAVEKFGDTDNDRDGHVREMTIGNVSALTTFTALTRPPIEIDPDDLSGERAQQVARGRDIFTGVADVKNVDLPDKMCAACHVAAMPIEEPVFNLVIPSPPEASGEQTAAQLAEEPMTVRTGEGFLNSLSSPVHSHDYLHVHQYYDMVGDRMDGATLQALDEQGPQQMAQAVQTYAEAFDAAEDELDDSPHIYRINLNTLANPGDGGQPQGPGDVPGYVFDRLPYDSPNAGLNVPLYSDLKLHDMGPCLTDVAGQPADVEGVTIPAPLFVTRPLWGVADTNPWMHDGRAITLHEAILYHGGKHGPAFYAGPKNPENPQPGPDGRIPGD